MGTTLSIKTGLGFAVPPAIVTAYEEANPDGDGFGEHLYDLTGYSGPLETGMAYYYYYDYTPDEFGKPAYAVFLKSTVTTNYGAGVFPVDTVPGRFRDALAYEAIYELATTLGITGLHSLEWLTVVSIG